MVDASSALSAEISYHMTVAGPFSLLRIIFMIFGEINGKIYFFLRMTHCESPFSSIWSEYG